jgi:putative PIN family toxin of toxin-antitoxin system
MKLIIDTNILISAAIRDRLPEKLILHIISNTEYQWYANDEILKEYIDVMKRPKFSLTPDLIEKWTELIIRTVIPVVNAIKIDFKKDILDSKFIECALTVSADYIITGDSDFSNVASDFGINTINVNEFYSQFIENQ